MLKLQEEQEILKKVMTIFAKKLKTLKFTLLQKNRKMLIYGRGLMIQFVFVGFKGDTDLDYLEKLSSRLKDQFKAKSLIFKDTLLNEGLVHIKVSDESDSECDLSFEIATFNGEKQLLIQINIVDPENFNELAYMLKAGIKDYLIKDWDECIWLKDSQSALYAHQLYLQIYNAENSLRELINLIMIKEMGVKWWESYVSENLIKTFKDREAPYKITAPMYKNIDTMLLSLNSNHLSQIMKYKKKKWIPEYNEKVERLIFSNETKDLKSIQGILLNQFEIQVDLWKSLFSRYFDDAFLEEWTTFCKNRNHIAHNKLIDKVANRSIKENIINIQGKIDNALQQFHSQAVSDESKIELEKITLENEKEIMEEESGIKVHDNAEINQIFNEEISRIMMLIEDEFHFRSDLILHDYNSEQNQHFFNIKSKLVNENEMNFYQKKYLSDEPGSSSDLIIEIYLEQELQYTYNIVYQNGEAYFDDEQSNYLPMMQNRLEELDDDQFLEDLNQIIDSSFPNKVEEISGWHYESVKDGGPEVVADFNCEECGEETVSIYDEFHTFGVCVSCGHNQSNSIEECMRCETYYNSNIEGGHGFCDSCSSFIASQ